MQVRFEIVNNAHFHKKLFKFHCFRPTNLLENKLEILATLVILMLKLINF